MCNTAQPAAAAELEATTAAALTLDSDGEAEPAATSQLPGAAREPGAAQGAEQPEALGDQTPGGAPPAAAADPGPPFPAPVGLPPPTPIRPPAKHAFPGTPSDGATLEDRRESRRIAMERQVHDTVAEELAEIAAQPDAPAADATAHSPILAHQLRAHTAENFDQFMLGRDDPTIAAVHGLAIEAGASPNAQPMSPSVEAHQRQLIRRRQILDDAAVAREVAEDVFGTAEATAARSAARIAELTRANPAAVGILGAGDAPANPIDLMHVDADEPAAPAGPAALPPRGTGVILPGAGTLTEEERATARAAHAQLAASTTIIDAAGDNSPIDGMPLNAHLRGADPIQARDFENLNTIMIYVTIISLGSNFDTANIAPMAAASALLAALKFALGPIIPGFDPQAAPVLEDPAHPGILRPLTLVVYALTPLALEILTSRRFWLINNIRLIVYRITEPASDFVYTLQGLFTEDEARVAALLCLKWGEPGGAVAAFLTRHRARFPDVADPLARLLEGVRAVKLVTIMPRSKGVEVVQFNTFAGMGFLPPDLHRQLRIILSNIPVRDSFLGISTHVTPSWFCKTCRASAHPTGLCGALGIRNWKPEEQQHEEPEAEHLLFGEERASRGRGGYRGRGGRGGRGRGRGFA